MKDLAVHVIAVAVFPAINPIDHDLFRRLHAEEDAGEFDQAQTH